MNKRTVRWVAAVAIVVACAVLGGIIAPQPLINRGIVVGLGVDKTDDGYEVTAQLAVAGENAAPGAPNKYVLMSAKGKSIALALDNISHLTAYNPSYFHCHLLLFGEKLVKDGVKDAAMFLFSDDEITDDVTVMGVQGSAKAALEKNVPVQGAASIYLQQELKTGGNTAGNPAMTLKRFVSNFETKGYSNFLPWVVTLDAPPSTGESESGGDKPNYIFDCSSVVLFGQDGEVSVQDKSVTEAISLSEGGTGLVLDVQADNGNMTVSVTHGYYLWHVDKGGKVTLRAVYYVKLLSQTLKASDDELSGKLIAGESKRHIRGLLTAAEAKAKAAGADLFCLAGKYMKKYGTGKRLPEIVFNTELTVKVSDG